MKFKKRPEEPVCDALHSSLECINESVRQCNPYSAPLECYRINIDVLHIIIVHRIVTQLHVIMFRFQTLRY